MPGACMSAPAEKSDLELAPQVVRRKRRDLRRARSFDEDELGLIECNTSQARSRHSGDFGIGFQQGKVHEQSAKSGPGLLRFPDLEKGKDAEGHRQLEELFNGEGGGFGAESALPASPVSILHGLRSPASGEASVGTTSGGSLEVEVGDLSASSKAAAGSSDGLGAAFSDEARAHLLAVSVGDLPELPEVSEDCFLDGVVEGSPAQRVETLESRLERTSTWVEESPTGKMDQEPLLEDSGSSSDHSLESDLASVRSSFEMFDRPSFDFTSEFKGEFRPLPTMVPEPSQNLEGFTEMASDVMSGDMDTPSTSSQEFMQLVTDQVEGKLSKSHPNAFMNLLGQGSGALDDETDVILFDHESSEQYVKASLRSQFLHFSLLGIASIAVAGFMLSLLFSNIKISSEQFSNDERGHAHGAHGHEWWIFGPKVAQGLVAMLAVLLTAMIGAYISDTRRTGHKAQVRAERREQDDLLASRRSERRAMERARTATRAKQQFMAYVFHNIRVPFNAIVLGLGHMRAAEYGDSLPGDKMDLVQMMLDCAETMTSVLDDVTDMSQWEDNKLELRTDSFDLLAVIRFLSWGLRDLLDQKNIHFGMVIDPRARAVLSSHKTVGDKHRVVQVLGQFLSNAVKLSPRDGEISLVMACEDLEWIEEEPLGQIGWRIVRTERKPSRNSSGYKRAPLSGELYTSPSLSMSDPPSSSEELAPQTVNLTPRGGIGLSNELGEDSFGGSEKRRMRRRSFERGSVSRDPFADLPAVQRVDSDDLPSSSGGADSEPGGGESVPSPSPLEERSAREEGRSPKLEANKPPKLEIPENVNVKERESAPTPGGSNVMPSPAGPFEMAGQPSIPSSAGSFAIQADAVLNPSSSAGPEPEPNAEPTLKPTLTPPPDSNLELATSSHPGGSARSRSDTAKLATEINADVNAALSSGGYGFQDRIRGVKLTKESVAPPGGWGSELPSGRANSGGLTHQPTMEQIQGEGEVEEVKSKEEIRKQKRKGLNETILELKGGELEGDRGRRPTPRKRAAKDGPGRRSFEVEAESMRERTVQREMNESVSPSGSASARPSGKSLASIPIVGFATIRISVKDMGPAISEEEQEKLFEPYSRIATGCMQRAGVSTLGLSLAKQFVRQVGGSIGVDSQHTSRNSEASSSDSTPPVGGSIGVDCQAPNGNSFWFSVPFPLVAETENENETTASQASSDADRKSDSGGVPGAPIPPPPTRSVQDEMNRMFTEKLAKKLSGGAGGKTAVGRALHQAISRSLSGSLRGDLDHMSQLRKQLSVEKEGDAAVQSKAERDANEGKRKVLLVEDTEINRIIMRKVLQNLGLLCDEAENGKVAVDLLKQGRSYDLILMDKEMPVMDGHEATRLLRQMGVKTPIIALTGNALKSDRELFFKAGVDEFQTKPLSRDKLVQLLVRLGWKKEQLGRRDGNVFSPTGPVRKATPPTERVPGGK